MNDDEKKQLSLLIGAYEDDFLGVDQTGLLACLKAIQAQYGVVLDEALTMMSTQLKTSPAILRGIIARSPSLRTQSKVHTITLCNGERCSNRGAIAFIKSVEKALQCEVGNKTKDGRFEIKTQRCLHRCEFGINLNIDASEHSQMTLEKLLVELKKL